VAVALRCENCIEGAPAYRSVPHAELTADTQSMNRDIVM